MKRFWFILLFPLTLQAQIGRFPFSTCDTTGLSQAGGCTFCSQYQDVYDELTTKPGIDTACFQNTMVQSLVSGGYWARMDLFYCFAQRETAGAKINWINPGTYDCTEDGEGALTFTKYQSYTGDGTNYLNTNYNPTSHATNFGLDDNSLGIYILNNTTDATSVVGRDDGNNDTYIQPRSVNTFYFRSNSSSSLAVSDFTDCSGLLIGTRRADDDLEAYRNGGSIGTDTDASNALTNNTFLVFTRDGSGMSTHEVSIVFAMDGIDDTEASNITTIIETYMDAINIGLIP